LFCRGQAGGIDQLTSRTCIQEAALRAQVGDRDNPHLDRIFRKAKRQALLAQRSRFDRQPRVTFQQRAPPNQDGIGVTAQVIHPRQVLRR
jgi:hypothetical protein